MYGLETLKNLSYLNRVTLVLKFDEDGNLFCMHKGPCPLSDCD